MNHSRVAIAALLLIGACRSSTETDVIDDAPVDVVRLGNCDGPATSLSPEIKATLQPPSARMRDDHWADLAATTPGGFAGVLYEDGVPILMLTRPNEAAGAKAALAGQVPGFPVAEATVRQARWDFTQLVDWFNYLFPQPAVQATGVLSGDKDESSNRVRFGIETEAARTQLAEVLAGLNVPCDLVLIVIEKPARSLD